MKGQSININTIVVRKTEIETTDIDGEKAMIDINEGKYFMLNEVAGTIWNKIARPCSVKEIILHLIDVYNVDDETCRKNTIEFLGKMYDATLITFK